MTSATSSLPAAAVAPDGTAAARGAIECEAATVPGRPIHIAFALGGTDSGRSGIGTYVREVLPPLIARARAAGGKFTAFGRTEEVAAYADSLAGAQIRRLSTVPRRAALNALWHLWRSDAFARTIGADVLLLPAANRRIARGARVPCVAVVHDLAQLRVTDKYDALRMYYFRRVLLPAFRCPARLIAVSAATRADLVQAIGVKATGVRVVHNGVNATRFRSIARSSATVLEAQRAAGLSQKPYLLYPARLEHPGKNHVRLLHAFARSGLAATHTLAFSGADWGGGDVIRRTVETLGLRPAIAFLGFVDADTLPLLVAGADAVLMLGLHEGFGLPPLEALSAGRPVCVSNTGALPEVVGPLGVQCDPLDENDIARALRRVIGDKEVRLRCEREGPAWADRFSWDRTAEGLYEACQEAAKVGNRLQELSFRL